ncbi:SDR family NAD(P)-dependent oxidoreductase [Aquabacterium sp.]|uniref:SDR family NAD(P)-dependent oxidoreductase n=1 Tax=Aquabacterium sp. TaxID=1872578 RepID=UPI0037842D47
MSLNPPIRSWQGQCVWLVGASTGIGRATASALHAQGAKVIVSARNAVALSRFVDEHAGAEALACDATDAQALEQAAASLVARHGRIDLTMYCAGHYHAMQATRFDLADALRHQQVNYVGALNWLAAVLPVALRQAAQGLPAHLSVVASVAGYRGLPQALAYGPTKAALINLAETLYLDLAQHGVGVSLINPGFVETPLTAQNRFRMPALMQPEQAAQAIIDGWQAGRFEIHFPKRFTLGLKALRWLPDSLYFAAVQRGVNA